MYDDHPDNGEHVSRTLRIFYRWAKIGCIGGQIKEKYGTIRWYASMTTIDNLHDIFKAGHVAYRWDPVDHPILDFINNMSIMFFKLDAIQVLSFRYKVLIYNIAYRIAIKASPGYEAQVMSSCDHHELIVGWKKLERKYIPGEDDVQDV